MSSKPVLSEQPANTAANAGMAMLSRALYLVTRLCIPPLVLGHISLAEYGLWTACFVLIMYVGLADAGFSTVYVRFTARYAAEGDVSAINRLLSTGVTVLSMLALLVMGAVWFSLPLLMEFLSVDAAHRSAARVLVMGTTAIFLADLTLGAYCYLLHGLQRIREEQKVAIAGYLLELVLILGFLFAGYGVYSLLMAFALRYSWSLLCFARLAHRFVPGLQIRPRHFDRRMLRKFLGFGATVQGSALLGTVLYSADRVLAGFLLGPQGIALFELAAKLPVSALAIPSAISNVALAAASHHCAKGEQEAIRNLHQQATRSTAFLAAIPLTFMAAFAEPIGRIWLGERSDLLHWPLIMALTAAWSYLHIVTGPGSAVFRAIGQAGNEYIYHGLRAVLLAGAVGGALMLAPDRVVGLAWGLAVGGALAAAAYLVINQRILRIPQRVLVDNILTPGLLVVASGAWWRLAWELVLPPGTARWELLLILALAGTLHVATSAVLLWTLVLSGNERSYLIGICRKLTGKLPQWNNS